jgi:hypothetical protein
MRGAAMGRPKKPKTPDPQKRLVVAGCGPWMDWVERGAKFCRTDVSKMVDAALAEYLRARGFPDAPPDRTS